MNKYLEIEKLLFRYDKYGTELTDNGTILIGHPNYLPKLWWLIQLYPKLEENDIKVLEKECDMPIPHQYKEFLLHFANGFDFQNGDFTLYGLRKILGRSIEASRQPFSLKTPNRSERNLIKNVKNSFFLLAVIVGMDPVYTQIQILRKYIYVLDMMLNPCTNGIIQKI